MAGSMVVAGLALVAFMALLDSAGVFKTFSYLPQVGQKGTVAILAVSLGSALVAGGMAPDINLQTGLSDQDEENMTDSSKFNYKVEAEVLSNANLNDDNNLIQLTGQQYNSTSDSLVKDTVKVQYTVSRFDTVESASIFSVDMNSDIQTTNESQEDSPYYVFERKDEMAKVKLEEGSSTDWTEAEYRVGENGEVTFNATYHMNTEAVQYGLEAYPDTPSSTPTAQFDIAGQTFKFEELVGSTKVVS